MPDWLFDRGTVIALAVGGGVFSILASFCLSRGWVTPQQFKLLNRAAYAFMTVSIVLFICAGFFGMGAGTA